MSAAGFDAVESLGREHNEIVRLRALLAEALNILRGATEFKQKDGSKRIYALIQPDCDLAARIDDALEKR